MERLARALWAYEGPPGEPWEAVDRGPARDPIRAKAAVLLAAFGAGGEGDLDFAMEQIRVYVTHLDEQDRELERLREALREAIEFAAEGWAYADDYFREKWGYGEKRNELLAALASGPPGGEGGTDES